MKTYELYACAIVFFKDGAYYIRAGFSVGASDEEAKRNITDSLRDTEGKVEGVNVMALVLNPTMLETVKEIYGLRDGLDAWREQLEETV